MSWFSIYGTGATLHGVQASENHDGRIEFTSWLSVLWIPIIPLRSWSAIYAGETKPDAISDEGHSFVDLKRIPHDLGVLLQTFSRGMFALAISILPAAYMIYRTNGRAATNVEMIFVFASAVWPVALLFYTDHRRKQKLQGRNHDVHRRTA